MKGIVLAGGSGTRLYPITEGVSKQILNIYDKPMIYYPISVLMLAGIRDILIITTKEDQEQFKRALGDGSKYGVNFSYIIQPEPKGLAQAFTLGEEFIGDDACAMVLGDNIFYGGNFTKLLNEAKENALNGKATIFGYRVKDPQRFGIMELDKDNNVIGVEEKPANPKSNYCITGLYFYPKGVSKYAWNVRPSSRGEVEITSLNDMYLKEGNLKAELLDRGYSWFDTGTHKSLLEAANFVCFEQEHVDTIIACLEQIGYQNGWLSKEQVLARAELMKKNDYGKYLSSLVEEKEQPKIYVKR